jgi:hypothetical protein
MPEPERGFLLRSVLFWTAVTFLPFWLALNRGLLDGDTYHWGFGPLGGSGVGDDYWTLPLFIAAGLVILWYGWRGARRPFHVLLLVWHVPLAALVGYGAWQMRDEMRFRGDTLGIDISLAWVGPALFGGLALAAVVWAMRDWRASAGRPSVPWTRANRAVLILALLVFVPNFFLLRFGEPHGTTDAIGVVLLMLQWALINYALAVRERPAAAPARTSDRSS